MKTKLGKLNSRQKAELAFLGITVIDNVKDLGYGVWIKKQNLEDLPIRIGDSIEAITDFDRIVYGLPEF
jgi:hypothetical protein